MWALQSQQFTLNWQFDFTHQLNYAAVEANWRLALDPHAADKVEIVFAAAFGCVRGQLHAFLSNKKIGLTDPGSKSF